MLVLAANILIRAALGRRVIHLIGTFGESAGLIAPDTAFAEAAGHLPRLARGRRRQPGRAMAVMERLRSQVRQVGPEHYGIGEPQARLRMNRRDPGDWPILACALAMKYPIWTQDTDFFGAGVATWTTDRVDLSLGGAAGDC